MKPDEFRHELALLPWIQAVEDLPEPLRGASQSDPELMSIVRERIALDACLDQVPEIEPSDTFVFRAVQRAWRDAADGSKGDRELHEDIRVDRSSVATGQATPSPETLSVLRDTTAKEMSARSHRRPMWIAAAALVVGLTIGLLAGQFLGGGSTPEPELLARLDFLLDLELIEENRSGLDVHRTSELMEAVIELSDLPEGG